MKDIGDHPERAKNLHFSFVVLLRAVRKAAPFLQSYAFHTGDDKEDAKTKILMSRLLDSQLLSLCSPLFEAFDETRLFRSSRALRVLGCRDGKVGLSGGRTMTDAPAMNVALVMAGLGLSKERRGRVKHLKHLKRQAYQDGTIDDWIWKLRKLKDIQESGVVQHILLPELKKHSKEKLPDVLKSFIERKLGSWAFATLDAVLEDGSIQLEASYYTQGITACSRSKMPHQALKLFEAMPKAKLQPNVISYNATISAFEKGGQWQQALKMFDDMQNAKVQPDVYSYSAAISACEKGQQWQQALKMFDAMLQAKVQPNVFSYSSTISACEKGGQWQQALQIFGALVQAKVQPDVISYNSTISACEKGGQWRQALKMFDTMLQAKVEPNVISYNSTISACDKGGQWQQALKMFDAMLQAKVQQDVYSYNSTISAYAKGGQWQPALKMFDAMLKAKIEPSVISYNSTISACEKGGQWRQALKMIDAMLQAKVEPNVISYNSTISACEKGGQQQQALKSLDAMLQAKVQPDVYSYNSTISACEKGGQWRQALKMFDAMLQANVQPDVISYSAAISACEKGGQWRQALKMFDAMLQEKVQPNVISCNAATSACEKGGQWQQTLKMLDAMLQVEVQPDVYSYNSSISACEKGRQWQQALAMFDAMLLNTVEPNALSYNSTISACENGGQWQQALKLFDLLPDLEKLLRFLVSGANEEVLLLARHYALERPEIFCRMALFSSEHLQLVTAPNAAPVEAYGTLTRPADAIILGGGLAGMSAAMALLDRRGAVVMVEKQPYLGGNSGKASSGINAALETSVESLVADTTKSAGTLARPELIKRLAEDSAEAVAWLRDRTSVDLSLRSQLGGHSVKRTLRPSNAFVGAEITFAAGQVLTKIAEQSDRFRLLLKSKWTGLTRPKDLWQVEIEVNGSSKTLYGHHVVIATGGFGHDIKEMESLLLKYRPDLADFPTTLGSQTTGDGVKLARDLGARLVDMDRVQLHPTGILTTCFVDMKKPTENTKTLCAELLRGVGGLLLDRHGNRFTNELGTRQAVVNAELKADEAGLSLPAPSPHRAFALVLNSKAAKVADRHVTLYSKKGLLTKVEGIEGLAQHFGYEVDTLRRSLQNYNEAAKNGSDVFGRTVFPEYVIEETEDFYVGEVVPVIHYTMGGIAINIEGQVLDDQEKVISGLYSVGEASGGVHGDNRLAGNSLLECTVFGRHVGMSLPIRWELNIVGLWVRLIRL
eukprot:g24625.t1